MDFIKWLAGFVYKTEKKIRTKFRRMPIKVVEKGKYAFIYSDNLDLLEKYGNFYRLCRYDVEKGIHMTKSGRLGLILRKMELGEKTLFEKQMEMVNDIRDAGNNLRMANKRLLEQLEQKRAELSPRGKLEEWRSNVHKLKIEFARKWDEPRQTFIKMNRD